MVQAVQKQNDEASVHIFPLSELSPNDFQQITQLHITVSPIVQLPQTIPFRFSSFCDLTCTLYIVFK